MAVLRYQGHGSYRITTAKGVVVYIDPYAGTGYDVPADLVLITHEHYDHNNTSLVTLKKEGMIIRERDLLQHGVYRHTTVKGISLTAVPAYNAHHDKNECVGYLLGMDDITLYAAGDTSTTKEMQDMKDLHLDWAILPIDGIYNMGPKEATACAQMIGARHTIPVHMKPGALFDPQMAAAFTPPGRVILHPGEEITLD
ncbi:MAG: MBL fold metallo-hydrolase [Sphaerochaeta sp.]|nr:MBL fold metallo-hydrolase [Sphaerochaeta sp.]